MNGAHDDGTRYAFDLTDYVNERIANDADGEVTVLIAHSNPNFDNVNTSAFSGSGRAVTRRDRIALRSRLL